MHREALLPELDEATLPPHEVIEFVAKGLAFDALARVAELDLLRLRGERVLEAVPAVVGELEARRDALIRRTDVGVEEAIELARRTLEALAALPVADGTTAEARSFEDLSADGESS